MSERDFNEIAKGIVYDFLIEPDVDKKIEQLKKIPMTCSFCNVIGLIPKGEPFTRTYKNYLGFMDEETVQYYICPNCGAKFKKYNNSHGGGIMEV